MDSDSFLTVPQSIHLVSHLESASVGVEVWCLPQAWHKADITAAHEPPFLFQRVVNVPSVETFLGSPMPQFPGHVFSTPATH